MFGCTYVNCFRLSRVSALSRTEAFFAALRRGTSSKDRGLTGIFAILPFVFCKRVSFVFGRNGLRCLLVGSAQPPGTNRVPTRHSRRQGIQKAREREREEKGGGGA